MVKETKVGRGTVVKAIAGREDGRFFAVTETFCEKGVTYAKIADGRERKLAAPKKKNVKHFAVTNSAINMENLTDKRLRKELFKFNELKIGETEEV